MIQSILIALFLMISGTSLAQDPVSDVQLAQHYYNNGEYDKALIYYEKLYQNSSSKIYFTRYTDCLIRTGEIKQAEKIFRKQINNNRHDQEYKIMLAKFYEENGEPEKAKKMYTELIDKLEALPSNIVQLYNAFRAQGKNDEAYQTLVQGRKLMKNNYPLNAYFADYYGSIGDTDNMMEEYIDLLDINEMYKGEVQRILSNRIDFSNENSKEYDILKAVLITRSQKHPNETIYAEMLTWLFIQRGNFPAAFTHMKSVDKRGENNGKHVFELGRICVENNAFSTANQCFQYVLDIGEESPYYISAQNAQLNVRFLQVTTLRNFTQEELSQTIQAYKDVLTRTGTRAQTMDLVVELAHIEAFYGDQSGVAIQRLTEALETPGITDMQRAHLKMELGDIHVLHGDIWEAALLYGQVDKDFKYESIGHEAKFKNARIFYYDGEFDYAQSQLDVLKESTSRLIANDAMKLSILITDNYGLDSNYIAMNWFARGDLLIEQHQYEEAFQHLDSITREYPGHSLGDEILLKKAHAMQLRGQWEDAIALLEKLLKFYGNDILADDALFELGSIYEHNLMDSEKATEYYRTILFDHKGSLYTSEAQKRFQKLRGKTRLKADPEGLN